MPCISKAAGRRAKRSEIWDSWIPVTHTWGTFDLVGFNVILRVIRYTFPKMTCNSKTAGRRAKRTEILESGTLVALVWGMLDLVGFKIFLGSFGALFSEVPVIWRSEILGTSNTYMECIDLVVFQVIWGGFGPLVSQWLITRKGLVVENETLWNWGLRNTST